LERTFTCDGILTIGSNGIINGPGAFALASGATLKIGSTAGITTSGATGNIRTDTRTYSAGANYVYNNGTTAQVTGDGFPTNLTGSLTIDNASYNVTLSGARTISNGGIVNLTSGTLVASNSLSMASTSTINRSGGSMTGNLQGAGVYNLNYSGSSKTTGPESKGSGLYNVIVALTVGQTLTNPSGSTVAPDNLFTINPGVQVTNAGTITAPTFNILSDATGTGTYLGAGTLTTTTTNVNQYLSAPRAWYMTSPVGGTVTPTTNAGALTIYRYLESANDDQTTGVSWLTSTTMTSNQGYSVTSPAGTTNVKFTGPLNNGNKSFTLTRNDHAGKSKNGFNLIGNPYPSYLDWTALYAANSSLLPEATMYYRTKIGSLYYFWTVNSIGIGVPSQASKYVPPMQAFWVRTITGGGTLNVTNAMRLHNPSGTNLLKAPAEKTSENKILRLQVSSGTTTDEAVVYFNTNASDGFDAYDSPKMMNGSTSSVPDIYTTIGVEELAINGMSAIPYDTEIPIHFVANASAGTSYSITANELSNFEAGTQVWIKNILSGVSQLISDGTPFTFDIASTGTNPKFSIIIKAPGTATQLENINKSNVYVYQSANNQITVSCSDALSSDANVSVYNSVGQCIVRRVIKENVTCLDNQLSSGVYLVTVINAGNKTTEKIIIR